ncbi:MAG TPA: hypothetical protein VGN57_13090 [Pirellulaceae bacterium]|jgi:hypothetical protein|nr:hypothetical protein [Pirellulaceae bacterium]
MATRVRRWAKRHRALVTSVAASGFVALVILGAASGLLARANHDLNESRKTAESHADAAAVQANLATEALTHVVNDVNRDLASVPEAGPVRRCLALAAIERLKKIDRERIDTLPADRTSVIAWRTIGDLQSRLANESGISPEAWQEASVSAREAFAKSYQIAQAAASERPGDAGRSRVLDGGPRKLRRRFQFGKPQLVAGK